MMNDDVLSLSMFWAGLLMVMTPLIAASAVLLVWWRQRRKAPSAPAPGEPAPGEPLERE